MTGSTEKPYSVQLAEITSRLFSNCNEKESLFIAKYDVSIVEFKCLSKLLDHTTLTVNHLAQKMSLTSSRVTRIIDKLVEKKLVSRVSGQHDRRIYNLSLTAKGKKITDELLKDHLRIHEEVLNNIPKKNHQQMITFLEQFNNAVEKWLKNN